MRKIESIPLDLLGFSLRRVASSPWEERMIKKERKKERGGKKKRREREREGSVGRQLGKRGQ